MNLIGAKTKSGSHIGPRDSVTFLNLESLAYAVYNSAYEFELEKDDKQKIESSMELYFIGKESVTINGEEADKIYKLLKEKLPQYIRVPLEK